MTPTFIIGKHFDIKAKYDSEKCCMCNKNYPSLDKKDVIKSSFMDHECLSDTKFICIYCAACVGYGMSASTALRATSFFANEKDFIRLKKNKIWSYVEKPCSKPHVLAVTFSNKKHIAFKSLISSNCDRIISTDRGNVQIDFNPDLIRVIKNWYRICKDTKQEPTCFTKNDILFGCKNHKKITEYGFGKYYNENEALNKFRDTESLNLLVYLLNKQSYKRSL